MLGQTEVGRATVYPDGTFDAVVVENPNFLGSISVGDFSFSAVPPSEDTVVVTNSGAAIAMGPGSVAISGHHSGVISTGKNNVVIQGSTGDGGSVQVNVFDSEPDLPQDQYARGRREFPWVRDANRRQRW